MKRALLVLVVPALAACFTGPSLGKFRPAHAPQGIAAELQVGNRGRIRIKGELLEVRDSSLLVLRDTTARVLEVPLRLIRTGNFPKLGLLIERGALSRKDREKLTLMSRFPGGMRPEVAAQLLAAYGQSEPERLGQP